MDNETQVPDGTPDFSRATKGTRSGRSKVSKREVNDLRNRVEVLEIEITRLKKPPAKKAPVKPKR